MESDNPKTSVYIADIAPLRNSELFDTLYKSVSEERRERTDRMRLEKDKCLSLGAEYLLMSACRDFGIDYKKERIITDAFSKPKFADFPVYFSLSHSEERVMCIMSELQVGCDVEKNHPIDLRIARDFFFEDEFRVIEACTTQKEQMAMFFRLWTLKESFMKCTGLGVRLPLDSFAILLEPDGIKVNQTVDDSKYLLFEKNLHDGYSYAWCLNLPKLNCVINCNFFEVNLDEK